jgi:hypothetical protein
MITANKANIQSLKNKDKFCLKYLINERGGYIGTRHKITENQKLNV